MINRSDYTAAENALLHTLGVPDDEEPTPMTVINIAQEDIPPTMQGPFVVNVPNRATKMAFRLDGVNAEAGDRLSNEILSRSLQSREQMLELLAELSKQEG